jgi:hypothetical protein
MSTENIVNAFIIPQLEITDNQASAIRALKLDSTEVDTLAQNAFDSALRGRVKGAINKKIIAKHLAISAGKNRAAELLASQIAELEVVLETIL